MPNTSNNLISLHASGDFGAIFFNEILVGNYSIWHLQYKIKQDTTIFIKSGDDQSSLGLSFTLKNNIRYEVSGLTKGTALKHHFNLVYLPNVECEYTFKKGKEYSLFGVQFSSDWLQRWKRSLPELSDFLDQIALKKPVAISKSHLPTTARMMFIIEEMIHGTESRVREMLMEAKVLELLSLSLEQIFFVKHNELPLKESEIRKIQSARDYILEHIDKSCTITELSEQVGLNDFKLKAGFKHTYNVTIHKFVLEVRMQRALQLLRETDMDVKKIAPAIGYRSLPHFLSAFKKRFGFHASRMYLK